MGKSRLMFFLFRFAVTGVCTDIFTIASSENSASRTLCEIKMFLTGFIMSPSRGVVREATWSTCSAKTLASIT
jgi:hypothetical protein